MKLNLIKIGNSQGIRLPKAILEQCNFKDCVEAEIKNGKLVLSSCDNPREGWDKAFIAMAKAGDNELLYPEIFELQSDDKEWDW